MTGDRDPFGFFENKDVLVVTKESLNDGKRRKYRGKLKIYGEFLTVEGVKNSVLLAKDDVLRVEVFIERGKENVERTTGQSG